MTTRIGLGFLALLTLVGCTQSSSTTAVPPADVPAAPAADSTELGEQNVELTVIHASEIGAELAKLEGKVVLLDMWASW